jgi:hypothetical protein
LFQKNKQSYIQTVNVEAYFHNIKTIAAPFTNIVRKYIYRVNQYTDVSSVKMIDGETGMSYGSTFCQPQAVVVESVT